MSLSRYVLFFFIFVVLFIENAKTQEDGDIFGASGNWVVYDYRYAENPNCMILNQFQDGEITKSLAFVYYKEGINFLVNHSNWEFSDDEEYDIFIQFDRREKLKITGTTSKNIIVMEDDINTGNRISNLLQNSSDPGFLYIHTQSTTFTYDARGLGDAMKMTERCFQEMTNPNSENPFLTNILTGSNPFQSTDNREVLTNSTVTDFILEPTVTFETYKSLMKIYESEDLTIEVQMSTFNIGNYESLWAGSLYNLYWEEDTSTRTNPRVFGDFSAKISDQCLNLATYLVSEVKFEHHDFYQGSIACVLKNNPEDTLYFRLSIYDYNERAFLFLTFGNAENQELVDLLDETLDINDALNKTFSE